MRAWLTPATIPTTTQCVRLEIPADSEIIGAVFGALLSLCEEFNWEAHGAVTPPDIAYAMLLMYNKALAGNLSECEQVQELSFWHRESIVTNGNPLAPNFNAAYYFAHHVTQTALASTDIFKTRTFHLTAGNWYFSYFGQHTTNGGICKFELVPFPSGSIVFNHTHDFYAAVGIAIYNALTWTAVPEGDYYIRATVTGKNGASTSYAVPLSLMHLVRVP